MGCWGGQPGLPAQPLPGKCTPQPQSCSTPQIFHGEHLPAGTLSHHCGRGSLLQPWSEPGGGYEAALQKSSFKKERTGRRRGQGQPLGVSAPAQREAGQYRWAGLLYWAQPCRGGAERRCRVPSHCHAGPCHKDPLSDIPVRAISSPEQQEANLP